MSARPGALRGLGDQVRSAWMGSPLPRFLAWWKDELLGLLPGTLRARWLRGATPCLLTFEDTVLVLRAPGRRAPLACLAEGLSPEQARAALRAATADIDPADLRLVSALGPHAALRRTLHLPAAAAADLRRVLGFEIDRQTPFRADAVYFDACVRSRTAALLEVELVAAPRAVVDPLLARLTALGIAVDAVDVVVDDVPLGLNLLPPGRRAVRRDPRRRLNAALAAAFLLFTVLALQQWLGNRRAALSALRAEVAAEQAPAARVAALRTRLEQGRTADAYLARRKAEAPSMVRLLSELTRSLPDGTWIDRLSVTTSPGQVGLQGESTQTAGLIERLQHAPMLADPAFQGVIQPDPQSGRERFYIVARLRGQGDEHAARAR